MTSGGAMVVSLLLAAGARAQAPLPSPPAGLTVSLTTVSGTASFPQGELIVLQLSLSSIIPHRYGFFVSDGSRDPGTVQAYPTITPAAGWHDPLAAYAAATRIASGSAFGAYGTLRAEPVHQHLWLNQWVRFDQPGVFRVTATMQLQDVADGSPGRPFTVTSPPLTITITAASEAWRRAEIARQAAILAGDRHDTFAVLRAEEALAALGGDDGARALAPWCGQAPDPDCTRIIAETGSPAAGVVALRQWMAAHPVTPAFRNSVWALERLVQGRTIP